MGKLPHLKADATRIILVAGTILIVVALLVGVTVFTVMRHHDEEILGKGLQLSLQNRAQFATAEIRGSLNTVMSISTRPLLIDQLVRVHKNADDAAARSELNRVARSFVQNGLSAIALYAENGEELTHVGVFTQQPELSVPVNLPGHIQLLWKDKFILQAWADILREGRIVGKVRSETDLATLGSLLKEAKSLGETGELALCAPFGLKMQCFPMLLYPHAQTLSLHSANGNLLPMAHALAGETGFVTTLDYRTHEVVAAYAPVDDLGLGMVLKMDSAELYASVWKQLRYLIPLLLGLLIVALLLLRWLFIPLVARLVRSEDEAVQRTIALDNEIAERKQIEGMMWKQANFDTLTNLPNRRMFHDRLEQETKKSHRTGQLLALMLIDLDRFKEVNDTLGHDKGDVLLVEAAKRISECVRESDTVARLGGDEFTIILSELEDVHSIERVVQDIIGRLAQPFALGAEKAFISASVGISLYPNDTEDTETLLKNVDQAMYVAKNAGRNRFSYFTPSMQEEAQNRLRLTNDMRSALAGEQFHVYYQPIVELASGKIFKAEALLRWQHPVRGMIGPMEFIPLAEESGLIIPIGDWVFKQAVQQVKLWRSKYHKSFQISVNKSPLQMSHDDSDDSWPNYLEQHGIPGRAIAVEITEGLLLNAEPGINKKLLQFRDAGIKVAIDDFGTGYSSLSYLKKFDIDYLKIDQSFIRQLGEDANDLALCEAIIVMAHKLGLKVVAEGVETILQRDLLLESGCDYAQGYLFSKPVPPAEFEKLLGN